MLHPVIIPSAAFTAFLQIYDKISRLKINVLQSCADILIVIEVALRFRSRLSRNRKQPFQTSQNFAGLLMIFRDFLQVETSILHKSL